MTLLPCRHSFPRSSLTFLSQFCFVYYQFFSPDSPTFCYFVSFLTIVVFSLLLLRLSAFSSSHLPSVLLCICADHKQNKPKPKIMRYFQADEPFSTNNRMFTISFQSPSTHSTKYHFDSLSAFLLNKWQCCFFIQIRIIVHQSYATFHSEQPKN